MANKKNEDMQIQSKDYMFAMTSEDMQREFANLSIVDIEDIIKVLKRTFTKCNPVNMAVTTEDLNGNKNSFSRKLADRIENSQEEILIAKKDVKTLSASDKNGRDSRKAIAWVKTLEARYYKLFAHFSPAAYNRVNNANSDDIQKYKNYLSEELNEQIALLKSDIESFEAEAKILKHNNNTLRFNNRNTTVISEKEDIIKRSKISLTRLSAIENSGGEIDRVKAEIAGLEERLNILNSKSEKDIKDEIINDLELVKLKLLLSFVANFGITGDLDDVKEVASKTENAYTFEEIARNYYTTFIDRQNFEGILEVDQIKPNYLENMVSTIDGYDHKYRSIDSLQTISELEWATEVTKVALESAKAGFVSEFTKDKLSKLVLVTNLPDDYFTTEIDSEFLNVHTDKFKSNDLVNLESLINVFNKIIKRTVKNNETRIQIKRLDSRIYESHSNLYSDIMFWYQQALMPINDLFGTDYELDFTDLTLIEKVINDVENEFNKALKDLERVINAVSGAKSTMRTELKSYDEEIDKYLNESRKYLGLLFQIKEPVRYEEPIVENNPTSEVNITPIMESVVMESTPIVEQASTAPIFENTLIETPTETLIIDESAQN